MTLVEEDAILSLINGFREARYVEFNTMVDIPLTFTTEWIGPSGIMVANSTSTEQPAVGNRTIYTSTATISSFGRNESGLYTCKATSSSAQVALAADPTGGTGLSGTLVIVTLGDGTAQKVSW